MPLPVPFLRNNPQSSKKDFGHILIIAGSPSMLGASALCALAAMRSGVGMVTAAVPKDLNSTLQKKIANVVMTLPLAQGKDGAFSFRAYTQIKNIWERFDSLAIGPGLGRGKGVQRLARQIILNCPKPLVVDADALFALAGHGDILLKAKGQRILTPHEGEMSRLTGLSVAAIEKNRKKSAMDFSSQYKCVLLLKGHRTVVAGPQKMTYINHTGNVGMATAGSGDVLTGMITAFLGQGISPFDAAKYGVFYHGRAGDLAASAKTKRAMIASDIIDNIGASFINQK